MLNANRQSLIPLWADVHGNSRLQREIRTNDAFFGGIPRLQSTIHVSDNKNMATKKGFVILVSMLPAPLALPLSGQVACHLGGSDPRLQTGRGG